MEKIKKEKVGWKERLLAFLGKHLMFRKQHKISEILTNLSMREILRIFVETEGNLESALKLMFDISSQAGHDFLMEWVEDGSVIFSKNVGDHSLWIEAGYYSFTGDEIDYIEYFPPEKENEPHRIVWRITKCFLCSGMENDETFPIKKEDLGETTYCVAIAGIFQTTINIINEYCGIPYKGIVKETRCMLKGAPFDEFVAEFYPIEKS